MSCTTDLVSWINRLISMKHLHHCNELMIEEQHYEDKEHIAEVYAELSSAAEMSERAYNKVTPAEYALEQDHISVNEQTKFKTILEKHKIIFDGKLGLCLHKESTFS